jgi:hypothetical protein
VRLPLSKDASAKIRLKRLLERERRLTECEGLENYERRRAAERESGDENALDDRNGEGGEDKGEGRGDEYSTSSRWEDILGIGEDLRRDVVRWILEVSSCFCPFK